jgi:beta-glucanase (GH16 family)
VRANTRTRSRALAVASALAVTLAVTATTAAGTATAQPTDPARTSNATTQPAHPVPTDTAAPQAAPQSASQSASQPASQPADEPAPPAPPASGPAPQQPDPAPASHCATTAADTLGWGEPTRRSDFDGTALPPDWHPYGPEPGHDKQGTRTPDQVSVADGAMTIEGDEDGTTGAVSWHPGQRYGRWEACVQSEKASGGLNALLLLWPVAEDFPVGGEVDWMEITEDTRQETEFFLHYGENNDQDHGSVEHDATQWSAYALEWTPEKITAYVNGKEWYSNTNTEQFPPRPMNMTMQLDYFGDAGGPTAMHMDWAKQWALPDSEPAELTLAPGSNATGQPKDFPERAPRELG